MEKNRIKELRKLKHITQVEIAQQLGISQAQMARLESGYSDMVTNQMRKIAQILGVKPYELLPLEEQPETLTEEEQEILRLFRKSKDNNNNEQPTAKAE